MTMSAIRKTAAGLVAAGLIAGAAGSAAAQDAGPDTKIENRQDTMAIAGATMKTLACSVKNEGCPRGFDFLAVQARAMAFSAHLSEYAFKDGPFPDATVETTALPKIWDEWDSFEKGLRTMRQNALAMVEAAGDEDMQAFTAAFKKTGKACKDCHDDYREDD